MRRRMAAALAAAGALAGLAALAFGPGAAPIVDAAADGARVWRLGALELEGVHGPHLGALDARIVRLRDEDGVWAQAEGLKLRWRPAGLLTGAAHIDSVEITRLAILRRPKLGPPPPKGGRLDAHLARLLVERLEVAEPVAGEAAAFRIEAELAAIDGALDALSLAAQRIDDGQDSLSLRYAARPIKLEARLAGPEGGFFAAIAGAPVVAEATSDAVGARLTARVGDRPALVADAAWTDTRWRMTAEARLANAPRLSHLAERFGAQFRVEAEGPLANHGDEGVHARLIGDDAWVEARSDRLRGPFAIQATAPARWLDLAGGALEFAGDATLRGGALTLDGAARVRSLRLPGLTLDADGPAQARFDAKAFKGEIDLAVSRAQGDAIQTRLVDGAKITARARWMRHDSRFELTEGALEGPLARADAAGDFRDGRLSLDGRWRLKSVRAFAPGLNGEASGDWRLTRGRDGVSLITAKGAARRLSGAPQPLEDLLRSGGALGAEIAIRNDLIDVRAATFEGRNLRFAAKGPIRNGMASLALAASARGPARLGGATLEGAIDAQGEATGPLSALTLTAVAALDEIDLAGLAAEGAQVRLELAPKPDGAGHAGRATLRAAIAGRPALAQADLGVRADAITFSALTLAYAGITGEGDAAIGPQGPTLDLAVAGDLSALAADARGALEGEVRVRPHNGEPALDVTLEARRVRFGPELRAQAASLTLSGPISDFAAELEAQGATPEGSPFSLVAKGRAGAGEAGAFATGIIDGAVGAALVSTPTPIAWRAQGAQISLSGAVAVDRGRFRFDWRETARGIDAQAELQDFPAAPLAAFAGERATGQVSGAARLSGEGRALQGGAELTLDGVLLARRARDPIDGTIKASLNAGRLTAELDARSRGGLSARLSGDVAVEASARPLRVARAPGASLSAAWAVDGPVEGVWAALGPLDQNLVGAVSGTGSARYDGERLTGAGRITLAGGRFEDKISGVRLETIDAAIAFDPQGVSIERFTASDGGQGRVSGGGRFDGSGAGAISLAIENFRLLNRPDAKARGGGQITLAFEDSTATLTGDLRLIEAEAAPPRAAAPVPIIDVIEINAPEDFQNHLNGRPETLPVRFDVRVRADERVFTRGRGLEAEWALNVRLRGALEAPNLTGEARLIRGAFDLAGRRFDLERGLITFDGDPLDATLDVVAVREASDFTTRVRIAGVAAEPKITLESTPALPEDEILPQALFGRAADQLSAFEAAQLAAGLATLAGRAGLDIAGAARNAVDLDRLDVREQDGGLLITGGRYITRDVYLELSRTPLGASRTSVEWQVRPRLFLISSFLPEGEQRVALRWRKDF